MENNDFVWLPSLGQDAENITHFFCKAVQIENESDIQSAYNNVVQHLEYFSNGHSVDYGVRAISAKDNIIQYFFNGENAVPGYIRYWLTEYYGNRFGDISKYSNRHLETYKKLRKLYLQIDKKEHFKWSVYKGVRSILGKIHIDI